MRLVSWIDRYRVSPLLQMQAVLVGWVLLLSFWVPHERLADFVPELWKPIPPFQSLTLSQPLVCAATWAWRASLVACLLLPWQRTWLALACVTSFFCFGLRNCFTLQIQLFASLQLALLVLLVTRAGRRDDDGARLFAFAVKLLLVLLFTSAGAAKLKWGGLGWATSDSLASYARILLPMNSDRLGFAWVMGMRRALLANDALFRTGAVAAHVFELLTPLALFSRRGSRLLLAGSIGFVLGNALFLGIPFFTLTPLLIIWAIWDVGAQELYAAPRDLLRPAPVTLALLIIAQVLVTIVVGRNYWPVMMNDMYAKPLSIEPFDDIRILALHNDGRVTPLDDSKNFAPFTKFHIFIALFRMKDQPARNALMHRVLTNWQTHVCESGCSTVTSMVVEKTTDDQTTRLAAAQL